MCDNIPYTSSHDIEIMKAEYKSQIEKELTEKIRQDFEHKIFETYGLDLRV